MGGVLNMVIANLHNDAEFVVIDEQANHDIVHLYGFGEADRFARQAFDAGAERQMLAFDLPGIALAGTMFPRCAMSFIRTPVIGVIARDAKEFQ